MNQVIRALSALGAVFFVSVVLASCGGGLPADAVVQVGSSPITKDTFDHWMGIAAASATASTTTTTSTATKAPVPVPPDYTACIAHLRKTAAKPAKGKSAPTTAKLKSECEQQYSSYKSEVLSYLISAEWVFGEAADLGVKVSEKEIDKEFAKDKKEEFPTEATFKAFLKSSGETVSDLLLRVKLDLLSAKIEKKVTSQVKPVTKAQIASYYKLHKSTYGTPEKKNLLIILTKTEAQAKAAKAEIQSGQSFASVAKRVSIDPTSKKDGGKLSGVVRGEEEKALESAVFAAKENVLSGPVKTPFGYYIFEVKKTIVATQQPLSKVQSTIKDQLTSTASTTAVDAFVKRFQKKWKAVTNCATGYIVSDCKQYKTTTTTTTAA